MVICYTKPPSSLSGRFKNWRQLTRQEDEHCFDVFAQLALPMQIRHHGDLLHKTPTLITSQMNWRQVMGQSRLHAVHRCHVYVEVQHHERLHRCAGLQRHSRGGACVCV